VPAGLPGEHGTALFRIAQEALQNCCSHAAATPVELVLRGTRRGIGLTLTDDGHGFDTRRVFEDGARGIGLRNMRERAESLGGGLAIDSGPRGTHIEAWLPLSVAGSSPGPVPPAAMPAVGRTGRRFPLPRLTPPSTP
jgi:two-component system NarL family sensor kinase